VAVNGAGGSGSGAGRMLREALLGSDVAKEREETSSYARYYVITH